MHYHHIQTNKGFTLVEMIVSLGIFAVVATVALGALVKIITANKKAQTLQSALTNLNSALESMAREIRVGTSFTCDSVFGGYGGVTMTSPKGCDVTSGTNDSSGGHSNGIVAFRSTRTFQTDPSDHNTLCNLATAYQFYWDGIIYHIRKGEQSNCTAPLLEASMNDVLDLSNIVITDYSLQVGPYCTSGANCKHNLSSVYPYVYIRVRGYAGDKQRDKTEFDIQTSVSSRRPQL